jgi:hypothetical protein
MISELIEREISLSIYEPRWDTVYNIPRGTILVKGRHGLYHEMIAAAKEITDKFGCYSWKNANDLFYCGSFREYSRHETGLAGRLHNYLQNHRIKENGQKNTNLMVFDYINRELKLSNIALCIFRFNNLKLGNCFIDYMTYSSDGNLVHAVEQLLISSYRELRQCSWNRS